MESVRIDRWLCAARIYSSRSHASDAVSGGLVKLNGSSVKASQNVKIGDEVRAEAPRGSLLLEVIALGEKRLSPVKARELYLDHTPPPPPKEERGPVRERGAGRPTKSDRRAMDRFFGR